MKRKTRSTEAGFTLVEVLTALTIMALMTSVVVLTLPSSDSAFRGEVRQLAARLELADQESIIGGRPLGIALSDQGYAFQLLRGGAWEEMENDKLFSPHDWTDQTQVTVERDSFFPVETDPALLGPDAMRLPQLRFDPTGLPLKFAIYIARGDAHYVLRSDGRDVEMRDANL